VDLEALSGSIYNYLVTNFAEFAAGQIMAAKDSNPDDTFRLSDLLEEWVVKEDVIKDVGGDRATYAVAVALIIAHFHDDPRWFFGEMADSVTGTIHVSDPGVLPPCLNPDQWREWVFRTQCGERLEL
jgi:hypothetical protein